MQFISNFFLAIFSPFWNTLVISLSSHLLSLFRLVSLSIPIPLLSQLLSPPHSLLSFSSSSLLSLCPFSAFSAFRFRCFSHLLHSLWNLLYFLSTKFRCYLNTFDFKLILHSCKIKLFFSFFPYLLCYFGLGNFQNHKFFPLNFLRRILLFFTPMIFSFLVQVRQGMFSGPFWNFFKKYYEKLEQKKLQVPKSNKITQKKSSPKSNKNIHNVSYTSYPTAMPSLGSFERCLNFGRNFTPKFTIWAKKFQI